MATAPLTARQKEELHRTLHGYLAANGFEEIAAAFATQAGIPAEPDPAHADALLKKWKSIMRLQKKVMDLETRITELQEAAKAGPVASKKVDDTMFLPASTPKFTLQGHRGPVTCVSFHPNFTTIASGAEDAAVRLWDYESGRFERTLAGHTDAIHALTFSPAGSALATAGADTSVKVWDMASFECRKTLNGHDHTVSALVFAPAPGAASAVASAAASGSSAPGSAGTGTAEVLYSASRDGSIKAWDPVSGYCLRTMHGHDGWVRALAASPSGSVLASGGQDQSICIWSARDGSLLHTFSDHDHVVTRIYFSTAKLDETIRKAFEIPVPPHAAAAAAGGARPAAAAGATAIEGAPSGALSSAERLAAIRARLAAARGAPSTAPAAGASAAAASNEPVVPVAGDGSTISAAAMTVEGGGQFVISCSRDRTVRIFDLHALEQVASLSVSESWVNDVILHPGGRFLLVAADDRQVRVLDGAKQFKQVKTIPLPAFAAATAWNGAPSMMAVGLGDNSVRLFECADAGFV